MRWRDRFFGEGGSPRHPFGDEGVPLRHPRRPATGETGHEPHFGNPEEGYGYHPEHGVRSRGAWPTQERFPTGAREPWREREGQRPWGSRGEPTWWDASWGPEPARSPERRTGGEPRPSRRVSPSAGRAPWSEPSGPYAEPGAAPQERFPRREPRGPYAGRGPKGYRRPDERLAEELCERLMEHPYIDPSEMSVDVAQGVVTLSGTVPDRWTKHQIEDLVETAAGVEDIRNQLRVARRDQGPSATAGAEVRRAADADREPLIGEDN